MNRNNKKKNKKAENSPSKILSGFKDFWKEKKSILVYVLIFGVLVVLFYVIYSNEYVTKIFFDPYTVWSAELSGKILNLIGYQNTVSYDTITSSNFSIGIKRGCDAIEPIVFFIFAIVAFPGNWKNKLIGIVVGTFVLVLLNFVRILSLFIIGAKFPDWFDVMHVDIWQVIFIISALTLWMLWINLDEKTLIFAKGEKK